MTDISVDYCHVFQLTMPGDMRQFYLFGKIGKSSSEVINKKILVSVVGDNENIIEQIIILIDKIGFILL